MNNKEIFSKVKNIFAQELKCDASIIKIDTSASDIEQWDSLAHINIILEIEKEFNIRFALGELQDLKSINGLIKLVESKVST